MQSYISSSSPVETSADIPRWTTLVDDSELAPVQDDEPFFRWSGYDGLASPRQDYRRWVDRFDHLLYAIAVAAMVSLTSVALAIWL